MPRVVSRAELFVWIPVALLELLEPRQLRAWAALAYAQARGLRVTEAELGQVLVHHSGRKAGEPIGAAAAGAVVDSLEALGFLVVRRRAGHQGRHQYLVLADPQAAGDVEDSNTLQGEAEGERGSGSSVGDGSGSPVGDGSLAYSEDTRTDRRDEDGGEGVQPAVGEVQVDSREAPVENPVSSNDAVAGGADTLALRAGGQDLGASQAEVEREGSGRGGYTGPELTYSDRMSWITEPVRWLLERSTVFVQRKLARELAAQLAIGIEAERLRERLQRRFALATPAEIRRPGGWLLKVGAPRWGCHDPKCESGTLWASGEPCPECRDAREERRRARQHEAAVAAGACRACLGE